MGSPIPQREVRDAARATLDARTLEFRVAITGLGIPEWQNDVHERGRLNINAGLMEVALDVTGIGRAGFKDPDLIFLYTKRDVLMRNHSFDRIVHRPWVRFTPADFRRFNGQAINLKTALIPGALLLAAAGKQPLVMSSTSAGRQIEVQVSKAAAVGVLNQKALGQLAGDDLTGMTPMQVTVDSRGRLVAARLDFFWLIRDYVEAHGTDADVDQLDPNRMRLLYTVSFDHLGAPEPLHRPASNLIAAAPSQ